MIDFIIHVGLISMFVYVAMIYYELIKISEKIIESNNSKIESNKKLMNKLEELKKECKEN